MNKESMRCRGARDYLPGDMRRFRYIENAFIDTCRNWGYEEVRTPTLEYLHLFTSAGTLTPKMLNNVYSFLDWDGWSGERVVLRPDGTIPVARLFMENMQAQTISRLFYITNVFSFESTGRDNRERWQCGVEYLGNAGTEAEIELIMLARNTLEKIGVDDIKLSISHSGLLKALISTLELETEDYHNLINSIQAGKWRQLGRVKGKETINHRLVKMLLSVKGKSRGYLENVKSISGRFPPKVESALRDFSQAAGALDALNYEYEIDITTIKNFEYYTGLYFKFVNKEGKVICSGGRYDDLLPLMGGGDIPACGFAIYMDPVLDMLNLEQNNSQGIPVAVCCPVSSPAMLARGYALISRLHRSGLNAAIDSRKRPVNSRYVIEPARKVSQYNLRDLLRNKLYKSLTIQKIIEIVRAEA